MMHDGWTGNYDPQAESQAPGAESAAQGMTFVLNGSSSRQSRRGQDEKRL